MRDMEKTTKSSGISKFFGELANKTSLAAGRATTFIIAAGVVIVWAVSGPLFGFSDTWQLVINTGTTIVTFLMVFLIQNSQNRDSAAIQVKLDELIRASAARNPLRRDRTAAPMTSWRICAGSAKSGRALKKRQTKRSRRQKSQRGGPQIRSRADAGGHSVREARCAKHRCNPSP